MLKHLNVVGQAADTSWKEPISFLARPSSRAASLLPCLVPSEHLRADVRQTPVNVIIERPPNSSSPLNCGRDQLFGDRPPLLDTLTGGRPPGRKVPDPQSGGSAIIRENEVKCRPGGLQQEVLLTLRRLGVATGAFSADPSLVIRRR
jgi:hypothetical protein